MAALLLQCLISKARHPRRVRRRTRWRHRGWHHFQGSRRCTEQRWSSQRCKSKQSVNRAKLTIKRIAVVNRRCTEVTIVTGRKIRIYRKSKLKSRKRQIKIQRIEVRIEYPIGWPKRRKMAIWRCAKRANLGENWAVKAGENDQSISQILNLKCKGGCNQLMSTDWPTGNEMILKRKLIWVAIATRSWRQSSKIKKPRTWTCQNMWMNKGDHYNCRMRSVNQSLQVKMMQIHWIETATSLRQKGAAIWAVRKMNKWQRDKNSRVWCVKVWHEENGLCNIIDTIE